LRSAALRRPFSGRDWVQQVFQPVVDHPLLEDALSGQPDQDSVLESHLRRLLDRGTTDALAAPSPSISARAAARELERRGFAAARGGKWSPIHVIRIRARLGSSP
jgi:hypothetical protein